MPDPSATLVVEFPCDRHCRAELDLAGIHPRFTHRQMLATVNGFHDDLHTSGELEISSSDGALTIVGMPAPAAVGGGSHG